MPDGLLDIDAPIWRLRSQSCCRNLPLSILGDTEFRFQTSLFIDKCQIIPIWLTEWQHSRLIQPFPHHSDAVKTPNCTSTACLKPSGFPQEFGKKHLSSTFCLLSLMHRGHCWQNSPQSATASPPCWTPATAHTFTHDPCLQRTKWSSFVAQNLQSERNFSSCERPLRSRRC